MHARLDRDVAKPEVAQVLEEAVAAHGARDVEIGQAVAVIVASTNAAVNGQQYKLADVFARIRQLHLKLDARFRGSERLEQGAFRTRGIGAGVGLSRDLARRPDRGVLGRDRRRHGK